MVMMVVVMVMMTVMVVVVVILWPNKAGGARMYKANQVVNLRVSV